MSAVSLIHRMARGSSRERGAATVEFAVLLIPLMLIICGIVDVSLAYNARITLVEAAAEGARAAVTSSSTAGSTVAAQDLRARNAARAALVGSSVDWEDLDVVVETCKSGGTAKMNITLPFQYMTPLPRLPRLLGLDELTPITLLGTGSRQCP